MPHADIRVDLGPRGASLRTISRELRGMDGRQVKEIFRHALEGAARPYPRRVRASVLAIPVKEGGKHTGLRARIAACAQTTSWVRLRTANVAVEMDPKRMPPGELSLPLGMQGEKRWRHPVFGNRQNWVTQTPHPYFYAAATPFGRAAGEALKVALDDITKQING